MAQPAHRSAEVTRLLAAASGGNREAIDQLFPLVYDELRAIGHERMSQERVGHTLNATALVHEAYLTLVRQDAVEWQSRAHFFAVASTAMRRILIDYARARLTEKRGGGRVVSIERLESAPEFEIFNDAEAEQILALDRALTRLREFNPRGAEVIEYRFFGGLGHRDIAEVTGVSETTVRRRWRTAKAWLKHDLRKEEFDGASALLRPEGAD